MKCVYLGLGSNRGDRLAHLDRAIEGLGSEGVHTRRRSSNYKTQPVDFLAQEWFANCVVEAETDLMPLMLLHACKRVERAGGRRRGVAKGPRPIDIDILIYEEALIHSHDLVVPHERMAERRFVLVPLCEIAPRLRHPGSNLTISELLRDTPDSSQVVRMNSR
ncbi:MAG: 2-amino-4-hydroxy-6-hydroxymethyldihydropteridine diphosphokinase [Acidobacteriota bacterium]|nr:2-amino-4-hydroxy-6-hydroxymethyldihydropteridine diphosphokinase [Acidobacteriota bacterium]